MLLEHSCGVCAENKAGSHEVKGAIRRNEGDCAVILKARQPDTLVKLHVL